MAGWISRLRLMRCARSADAEILSVFSGYNSCATLLPGGSVAEQLSGRALI